MLTTTTHRCRGERGSVIVTVALTLTALLGMGMIVIDVANWWVHKRHLQGQADAAAFAGAQALRGCTTSTQAAVEAAVGRAVQRYAGTTSPVNGLSASPQFNSQIGVGTGESVLGALNSKTYPYPNGDGPSVTNAEPNTGHPCQDKAVDVKLTD
ncbi:MAG: putative Flp pilus-assembly TadE/G-like, partial [Solirubrobacteraceae bacterium]|nr:putative Flp pilus-assembly TadE/G-like [Solirubrobacteraceae bacterium]